MTDNQASIPQNDRATVERLAETRAEQLSLDWSALSAAHQQGLMETIWAEMNWRD